MAEGAIFARQARDRSRIQTDLCPGPIFTIIAVGNAGPERDVMEPADLDEIIADLVDLLLAALGLDFVRGQWRQFRDWAASRAKQIACDQEIKTYPHTPPRENGRTVH